jgi:hypothetical protein
METIKVYRNINTADRLFGLELADGAALLLVFFLAFMVNREGLFSNLLVLTVAYAGLRALKRGKPDGYVLDLARHVLSSRFKAVVRIDEAEPLSEETKA